MTTRLQLQIQCHYPDMPVPTRAHASDAGLDLTAMSVEEVRPGLFAFDTGISIAPPAGYYAEVVPRSSIIKTGFMLANSVGIIDPDYRGRIKVMLRHVAWPPASSAEQMLAEAQALVGNRIAQLLVRRLELAEVNVVPQLETTVRGSGGFGSSGS